MVNCMTLFNIRASPWPLRVWGSIFKYVSNISQWLAFWAFPVKFVGQHCYCWSVIFPTPSTFTILTLSDSSTGPGTRPFSYSSILKWREHTWRKQKWSSQKFNGWWTRIGTKSEWCWHHLSYPSTVLAHYGVTTGILWVSNDQGLTFLIHYIFHKIPLQLFHSWISYHFKFLHMPRQLCCRGMCKILWWLFC